MGDTIDGLGQYILGLYTHVEEIPYVPYNTSPLNHMHWLLRADRGGTWKINQDSKAKVFVTF